MTRRGTMAALAVALVAAAMLGGPTAAQACLAHYCSPERLAVESPLIVVGEVEAVEDAPPPPGATLFPMPRGAVDRNEGGKYAIATIRVQRVIKGEWKARTIRIGAGPIESCAPYPCYCDFSKGQNVLVLLPHRPEKDFARLSRQGSLRDVGDVELIESCMARAHRYRADYLRRLELDDPKAYADAAALAKRMAQTAGRWPKQKEVPHTRSVRGKAGKMEEYTYYTLENTPETEQAVGTLAEELSKLKIESIRAAMAIAWLHDDWPDEHTWQAAMHRLKETRGGKIVECRKSACRAALSAAGVEEKFIDSYLRAVEFREESVAFPEYRPDTFNLKKDLDPADYTTDFILHYQQFDRGSMFVWYGMGFEGLKRLDLGRAGDIVAAMCGSADEYLARIGFGAIREQEGDELMDVVVAAMEDGQPGAWQYLKHWDDDAVNRRRMRALAEAGKEYSSFWYALARTDGFDEPFVETAVRELKELPGRQMEDRQRDWIRRSLTAYLSAGVQARKTAEAGANMTAEQYEEFFRSHPAKKAKTD